VSPLRHALADYLTIRRALGSKLTEVENLLVQFVAYLEQRQVQTVTIENALAWATSPQGASARWWAIRMSAVRGFATHLRTVDGCAEIPPPGLIADARRRATPYLYSDTDVRALVEAAARLRRRLNAATYPVLISLLAVTGMRVGEAIALDVSDFDDSLGVLTVRAGKFGKSRLLPLHPTATAGLGPYLQTRNRLWPTPTTDALLISSAGTRLIYNNVQWTFSRLARQAGLAARSATCRPRIHDLRHSFCGRDDPGLVPPRRGRAGAAIPAVDLPGPCRPETHVLVPVGRARTPRPGR